MNVNAEDLVKAILILATAYFAYRNYILNKQAHEIKNKEHKLTQQKIEMELIKLKLEIEKLEYEKAKRNENK